MSASTEQQIIKQYQPLIRALIPYEQDNRLLEGLNKFTGRVPGNVRKIIKDEVMRLTCITDAPADNSAFAEFPVFKFSHFGVEMRLDKVGARILQTESQLYQDRYTVGVFETITNSDFYQAHLKKENYKKIVDAFTVETQSLDDIHFGNDLAIAPNFPVSSLEFEKGKTCTISSLGYKSMSLESKRPPKVSAKEVFNFQFPEVPGLPKGMAIKYVVSGIKFNKQTEKYETQFRLHPSTDPRLAKILQKYIDMASFQQPLQRELESERAMQDLERDRVLDNSPWVPLFIQKVDNGVKPLSALFTAVNESNSGGIANIRQLTSMKLFPRILKELFKYKETFVVSGVIETKKGEFRIVATLRELESADLLAPVIHLLNKNESLHCLQCRLSEVVRDDRQKAYAIHDLIQTDYEELDAISHILFCKNVSASLHGLAVTERRPMPAIPEELLEDTAQYPFSLVFDEDMNRRSEARYIIDKEGVVKSGLLSSSPVLVKDISSRGMRIVLSEPFSKPEKEIKVSVPELKIKNQKYDIVGYSAATREVRLRLPSKRDAIAAGILQFVHKNYAWFKNKDTNLLHRNTHRFLWELAVRHHPSASILCITNRYLLNRLKTVYQTPACDDLYPFSAIENVVPMHGFFADKDAQKPKSKLLVDMFHGAVTGVSVVHCVRKSDNKLVYLPETDFLYGSMRKHVHNHIQEDKVELCVTKIDVVRCQSESSPMTKKRLAQLSRIDKPMYDRFNVMQSSYSHVLYLTSESVLQQAVLRARLRPVKPQTAKASQAESA